MKNLIISPNGVYATQTNPEVIQGRIRNIEARRPMLIGSNVYYEDYDRILYGIYAHENNGVGDGTSTTHFKEGTTYYTAMAALDAPLVFPLPRNIYNIYRFTWMGDSTNLYFKPMQSMDGEW